MRTTLSHFVRVALLAAAVGMSSHAFAAGVAVDVASDEQKQAASDAFKQAKAAFDERRLDDALLGFRASYDIVASPNALLMVAVTLASQGNTVEAYEMFDTVIREANAAAQKDPKYAAAADAARGKQAELRPLLGMVHVVGASSAAPGTPLTVNGREIPPERWSEPIAVKPGPVSVVLGGQPPSESSVAAGAEVTVDLAAAAPPPADPEEAPVSASYSGPDRMLIAYIAGGVGAAGMISFAIFGGLALGKYGDLEDSCPNQRCSTDLQGDADSGQTFQAVANVSLAVGVVGLVVGAGFFTWAMLDPAEEGGDGGVAVHQLSVGPGSVAITGSF